MEYESGVPGWYKTQKSCSLNGLRDEGGKYGGVKGGFSWREAGKERKWFCYPVKDTP